jgi:hypothetical protein
MGRKHDTLEIWKPRLDLTQDKYSKQGEDEIKDSRDQSDDDSLLSLSEQNI